MSSTESDTNLINTVETSLKEKTMRKKTAAKQKAFKKDIKETGQHNEDGNNVDKETTNEGNNDKGDNSLDTTNNNLKNTSIAAPRMENKSATNYVILKIVVKGNNKPWVRLRRPREINI
ncbi:uncharacterized protein MELLADRAFT_103638 [Melampsora larici-populina 98AG31]|uniref:Uncharacterized protein n=1 Tax=Melampsora larici-populina (strain 98AG31 / pathotype 3-4-7) TaxID=747676 RepID=F4RBZ5_MELLP|nr:uncharacterized protein MELLADRAFT_103638 [Melampsora larici-populina 98AG31]EGG10252.1 hypothetical protein MELLADRAFT_103638 [Melampsora larici-populina 98AG31]